MIFADFVLYSSTKTKLPQLVKKPSSENLKNDGKTCMQNDKKLKIKSVMDLTVNSTYHIHTPNLKSKRFPFYTEGGGHFFANMGYFTEREGLESYLFILTIKGCGYIKTKNKEILLAKNRAVLIDCMEYQYYQTASDSVWDFVWIHLNGTAASFYCDLINGNELETIDFADDFSAISKVFNIFDIIDNKDNFIDVLISEKLISLFTKMMLFKKNTYSAPGNEQYQKDIDYTIEIIKNRYNEALTITELSKHAHISKFYFIRVFKEITGLTPYDYLISYRINEAKKFLLKTYLSINEIANLCGFVDASNFIRCFKKATGTTPKVFRRDKSFFKQQ